MNAGETSPPAPLRHAERGAIFRRTGCSPYITAFQARHPSPRDGEGPGVRLSTANSAAGDAGGSGGGVRGGRGSSDGEPGSVARRPAVLVRARGAGRGPRGRV